MTHDESRLGRMRLLAASLDPRLWGNVLHQFFTAPMKRMTAITNRELGEAWGLAAAEVRAKRRPERLSLYVHVPFCPRLCQYCIYYRKLARNPGEPRAYVARLEEEIDFYAARLEGVGFATFYLGGGTPTVLDPDLLRRLLQRLHSRFTRLRGGEWCFETSPYTLTEEKADLFAEFGFNRASFGVQTFSAATLAGVNRSLQTERNVEKTVRTLLKRGFYVNADLIHGLPGDSLEATQANVARLIDLGVTNIALQLLSPYTPALKGEGGRGDVRLLAEVLSETAERSGYRLRPQATTLDLEQSRSDDLLTREKSQASHRLSYSDIAAWGQSILGLGPTARGSIFGRLIYRFDAYEPATPFTSHAVEAQAAAFLPMDEQRRFILYQLSQEGVFSPTEYRRLFGEPIEKAFGDELTRLTDAGRLIRSEEGYRHASADPLECFASELLFLDESHLAQAERKAALAAKETDRDRTRAGSVHSLLPSRHLLTVTFENGTILAGLFEAETKEDPGYARSGRFAFFIPSECYEKNGELGPGARKTAEALRLLLREVVARTSPRTVDELKEELIRRAARLPSGSLRIS